MNLPALITRVLLAADRLRLLDMRVLRDEARLLAQVRRHSWHEVLGFARFGDFARESLGMAPRSAHEAVELDRLLCSSSALETAYGDGRLSACQVRALAPIARMSGRLDEVEGAALMAEWAEVASALPVRELRERVRAFVAVSVPDGAEAPRVVEAAPEADDEDDLTDRITFEAPPIVRAVADTTLELASRMIGRRAARWECLEAALIEAAPECAVAGVADAGGVEGGAGAAAKVRTQEEMAAGGVSGGEANGNPEPAANVRTRGEMAAARANGPPGYAAHVRTRERAAEYGASPSDHSRRAAELATDDTDLTATRRGREALIRLGLTLEDVERTAGEAGLMVEATAPISAEEALDCLLAHRALRRPMRILLARLLRDLRDSDLIDALGGGPLDRFIETHFGLSPRTARHLAGEARLFEDRADLEAAWSSGRIGLAQAAAIHRIAPLGRAAAWIMRAATVTTRQFHREVVFHERLRLFANDVAMRHPGPFPEEGIEVALGEAIARRGGNPNAAAVDGPGETDGPERPQGSAADDRVGVRPDAAANVHTRAIGGESAAAAPDPAEDPSTLRRLEALLDELILLSTDDAASGLVALNAGPADAGPARSDSLADRQTFAHVPWRPRPTRLTFAVPRYVAAHWHAAIAAITQEFGPVPPWMAATILFARAALTWMQVDPDTRPTEWRTLDRDEYACQAPGCSARKTLEVHHIIPRAQQGPDAPWNVVTLCHAHHHHGVHKGRVRVSGRAPGALRWGLGRRANGAPIATYRGERRVG